MIRDRTKLCCNVAAGLILLTAAAAGGAGISITTGTGTTSITAFPAVSQIHPLINDGYWPPASRTFILGRGGMVFQRFYRNYGGTFYAHPPYWWVNYRGRRYGWNPYRNSTYQGPPLWGMHVRLDPDRDPVDAVADPEPPPQPPPDPAMTALRTHEYELAAAVFRRRGEARLEALAQVGDLNLPRAVELFAQAYREDDSLPRRPLDGAGLVGGRAELRKLVTRAVRHAHRDDTAEAWFAVSVLMQAEGRDKLAGEMLERASRAEAAGRGVVPRARPAATAEAPAEPSTDAAATDGETADAATPATLAPVTPAEPPAQDQDDGDAGAASGGVIR